MIDIGVITSPRELPTLNISIKTLRKAGYTGTINIFSEPGLVKVDGGDINIFVHKKKMGAFRNYDYALEFLLVNGNNPLVCVLEDDYIYSPDLMDKIKDINEFSKRAEFGYFNVFTNGYHPRASELFVKEGWNKVELGWHAWGVGYIFRRDKVKSIREHPYYQEILAERNQQIDGTISEVCLRQGLAMYYHNPSLSYSIGYSSTLGHEFRTDGYRLRGK